MPTIGQVRGMLLEEAILYLLKASGYRTIDRYDVNTDPTLTMGGAGIQVAGRGTKHQIDAIADYRVTGNPCIALFNPNIIPHLAQCSGQLNLEPALELGPLTQRGFEDS